MRDISSTSDIAKTVLILESDPALLEGLTYAFRLQGYVVYGFAEEDALWTARDLCRGNSCLVMDQNLSNVDGLDLLSRLRKAGIPVPSILISKPKAGLAARARRMKVPIVQKPVLEGPLLQIVESLFSKSPVTPSAH